ncbi:hypothetical protein J7M23_03230 [Candidatus Sumerlaeota bacterium]|nr:hypothetical protein [Candidatus Sumerlaeota bacterium]
MNLTAENKDTIIQLPPGRQAVQEQVVRARVRVIDKCDYPATGWIKCRRLIKGWKNILNQTQPTLLNKPSFLCGDNPLVMKKTHEGVIFISSERSGPGSVLLIRLNHINYKENAEGHRGGKSDI